MKRLSRFFTNDLEGLARQQEALEANAADAIKQLDGAFLPVFTATRREAHCRASVGEHVVANTESADITVTFPKATVQNAGRCIAVKKTSAAFTCTVAVVEGTVDGTVSFLLGTVGRLYIFLSDGSDWGVTG